MRQFCGFYYHRLQQLKPRVREACEYKFAGSNAEFGQNILDMRTETLTIIVGTLFKEQKKKPCVFDDLEEILPSKQEEKVCGKEDYAILEDASGRIELLQGPSWDCNDHVTGTIIGLLGSANKAGYFEVQDFCYAGIDFKAEIGPGISIASGASDVFSLSGKNLIAFFSGLSIEGDQAD